MGRAVGIDLGTTNSVLAVVNPGSSQPRSIRVDEGSILRSMIAPSGDGWLVGHEAEQQRRVHPENVIRSSKRFIGLNMNDPRIGDSIRYLKPLEIVDAPIGESGIRFRIGGRLISATEVASVILRRLKERAEGRLGQEITHAVISTPAYFDTAQNEATRQAGEAAGFVVQRILEEPVAAVLAYGAYQERGISGRVLVYDLGGGTFDVTLGNIRRDGLDVRFAELSKRGDNHLGGDDFDELLLEWVARQIWQRYGVDLLNSAIPNDVQFDLRMACREAKHHLSDDPTARINEPGLLARVSPGAGQLDLTVSRSDIERLIRPLIERTLQLVDKTLDDAHIGPGAVDQVLLVGGSSLIPLVRDKLRERFGPDKVRADLVDPMQVVAEGAATLAGSLPIRVRCPHCRTDQPTDVTYCTHCGKPLDSAASKRALNIGGRSAITTDIVSTLPIPIGIAVHGGGFDVIIPRGTPYSPTSGQSSEMFSGKYLVHEDGQRYVRIDCYEGEDELAIQNRFLYKVIAGPLKDARKGDELVVELALNGDRLIAGGLKHKGEAVHQWDISRDQWVIDAKSALIVAQDAMENSSTAYENRERLTVLSKRLRGEIETRANPTLVKLLTGELEQETKAAIKSKEWDSVFGDLKASLRFADMMCESAETWIVLSPQVRDQSLRDVLEADGRQLETLRTAREEGLRAYHTRDELSALRARDRINGLLGSLRIADSLALAEAMSHWDPDSTDTYEKSLTYLPVRLESMLIRQDASNDAVSTRPSARECLTELAMLVPRMRRSLVEEPAAFRAQLARARELQDAFFEQSHS